MFTEWTCATHLCPVCHTPLPGRVCEDHERLDPNIALRRVEPAADSGHELGAKERDEGEINERAAHAKCEHVVPQLKVAVLAHA